MKVQSKEHIDIATPTGVMRTHLFVPVGNRTWPTVLLYSEIYQMTGPIARTAAWLAGHGFMVAVPEVYHEYATPGEAFAYDQEGTDRGNRLKTTKPVADFDSDARSLMEALKEEDRCNGRFGVIGICLGGHLAFRAAMNPHVKACVCLYATDIHKRSLGLGMHDDSLDRISEIQGELLMIWGRQDPHIPREGRRMIYDALTEANRCFTWHEFNGEHAFMRDEGHRYDPANADIVHSMILELMHRCLS